MKVPKIEKLFLDKCPPLGTYPNKSPPPGQKLGCKSPGVGANFRCKSPGVRGGGMVMAKIDNCITKTTSGVSIPFHVKILMPNMNLIHLKTTKLFICFFLLPSYSNYCSQTRLYRTRDQGISKHGQRILTKFTYIPAVRGLM